MQDVLQESGVPTPKQLSAKWWPRFLGVCGWRWVGILGVEGVRVFCDVKSGGLGPGTHGVCSLPFMGVKYTNSSAQREWFKSRTTVFGSRFMCSRVECGGTFY